MLDLMLWGAMLALGAVCVVGAALSAVEGATNRNGDALLATVAFVACLGLMAYSVTMVT